MNLYWALVFFIGVHWIADFVLQTHWQASNKSKSNEALSRHVLNYTLAIGFAAAVVFPTSSAALIFTLLNGALHWITDYFTSRWSSRLWAKQDWHNFFVVIGFDQLIHYTTLAVTLWLFAY